MKKGLVIILFLTMSLASFAQQDVIVNNETELVETVKPEANKVSISAKVKAKVLKMNRKRVVKLLVLKLTERVFRLELRL